LPVDTPRQYIEIAVFLAARPAESVSPLVRSVGISQFFKSILEGGKVDVGARYQILREAVSGTMSNFHMARDRETEQIVGLKVLDKKKTEALEARFKGLDKPTEGEIAISLNHPRIVNTYSHGITTNDEQFLVMEFLDGPGLNSLIIARSKLLDGNRLTLARHAAEALEAGAPHGVKRPHAVKAPWAGAWSTNVRCQSSRTIRAQSWAEWSRTLR